MWILRLKGLLARDTCILADRLAQNVHNFRTSVNDQRLFFRPFVTERKKLSHSFFLYTSNFFLHFYQKKLGCLRILQKDIHFFNKRYRVYEAKYN